LNESSVSGQERNDSKPKIKGVTEVTIDIEDSDNDDEPLVKKHNAKHTNDLMNQDDMDFSASLSNRHENTKEEFACPVCSKLVPSSNINTHLDLCVQT